MHKKSNIVISIKIDKMFYYYIMYNHEDLLLLNSFFLAPTSIYKQVYSCEHDQNLWYRIQQYGGKYSYPKKKN